jgi:ABC-type glycerol-3-phosphate transport system substrate-binding protein
MIEGLRASHSIQGKVVQNPYISDALPIGLNLELLDKANLKVPPKNWTWNDLAEYATKLTVRAGDETRQWGMLGPHMANNDAQIMFGQVLHSFGGTWADADGRKAAFASPQGVAALEYWVDLVRRRQVSPIPWPANWMVAGQDARLMAFVRGADGGVAMRQFQTFVIGQLKTQPLFRWQAVLPPQQPKMASIQGTGTVYVVKGAPHKDAATAFLLHLTDPEQLALFAADYARIPTYKTVVSHPVYQEFLKRTPEMQVHAESALGAVGTVPPVLGWGDGAPALRQAILDAVSGAATPSAALRDAAAVMDSALAKAQGR